MENKMTWKVIVGAVALVAILPVLGLGYMALMTLAIATWGCEKLDDIPFIDCEVAFGDHKTRGCNGPLSDEISENIPQEWAEIMDAAGADPDHPTNPNLLAAIYLTENGNSWKPFDYPWPESSAAANGPMQFIPGSWESHKQDGDGDGDMDIQDPWDSVFASAHHIQRANVPADAPLGDLDKPGVPGTLLWAASDYNWGGEDNLSPDSPLSSWPTETQNYLRNVHALLSSDMLTGGHPNYVEKVRIVDKNDNVVGYPGEDQASGHDHPAPEESAATASAVSVSHTARTPASGPTAAPGPTSDKLIWPVDKGTPVTSPFGNRDSPDGGGGEHHGGTDFAKPGGVSAGEPIYAVADGTVTSAGPASGFGQWVVIQHEIDGKRVDTWYGHMPDGNEFVSAGDKVEAGDQIARIGSEGRSTGPHLHFEVHPNGGDAIDPIPWLESNGAEDGDGGSRCSEDGSGSAIVDAAASQEGLPYVLGGGDINGPTMPPPHAQEGFDCSGLVLYAVYQGSGGEIELPHRAADQAAGDRGEDVSGGPDDWQPGDILFRINDGVPDHVTIYAGEDDGKHMMWSAPSTGDVVKYSEVYFTPTSVKRYL